MTIQKIREHLEIKPFKPIVVRTVSGARHAVYHPDFLFVPPVGETILVVDTDGTMHHLDVDHVEVIETAPKPRNASA